MIVSTKSKKLMSLKRKAPEVQAFDPNKLKVETYSYNLIDVRVVREDEVAWLLCADLQPFFDKHIHGVFATAPEDCKRNFKRDRLLNHGFAHGGIQSANALKESYFLDKVCVRKTGGMQYVCYQCGGEIQSGGTVKKGFRVCYDGATEKRIARFHASCYRG